MEISLVLAMLAYNFDFEFVNRQQELSVGDFLEDAFVSIRPQVLVKVVYVG